MTEKIKTVFLIMFLIALDIFFISQAVQFAGIYPFNRIAIGNRLLFRLNTEDNGSRFKSDIISIQGKEINENNLINLLEHHKNDEALDVAFIYENGELFQRKIVKKNINRDMLWLFFTLLLLANIQFVWGLLVKIIHSNKSQARLFFQITLGLSIFLFALIDFFSYSRLSPLLIATAILISFITLKTGYNLSNQRLSRTFISGFIAIIIAASLYFVYTEPSFSQFTFRLSFTLLAASSILSLLKLLLNIIFNRNIYNIKRSLTVIIVLSIGFIATFSLFLYGLFHELIVPAQYIPLLTIIIPISIGNGLLQYNIFSARVFPGTGLIMFSINAMIAIIAALSLFYIINSAGYPFQLTVSLTIFAILIIVILRFKRLLRRKLSNILFINRDDYALSLQNIAELVSLPDDLYIKIDKIFTEVITITEASLLKIVLFEDSQNGHDSSLKDFVEYFPEDSTLFQFFSNNRDIIFRYSLIKSSFVEDRIFKFLENRDIILVIPVYRGKEAKGALLVGEKKGDRFFSETDTKYLKTVSFQTYQLIENDRLFNEYLLRSSFEKELDIASYIQLRLFPKKAPQRKGLIISFYNRPYLKVTGDYFDFINIDRDRTAIVIGDVSGHGLAAAMVLSMTSSITNAMLMERKSIERTVQEINHFLNHRYRGIELITLFIGIYNKKTREIVYINAGHCSPVLIKPGKKEISFLEGRSKILGADPAASYFSSKFTLEKNDELLLYTDGASEIFDEKTGKQHTEENLISTLTKKIELDIEEKINEIIKNINSFKIEAIQDDITLIGIKIV